MTRGYNTTQWGVRGETKSSPAHPIKNLKQLCCDTRSERSDEGDFGEEEGNLDDTKSTSSRGFFESYYIHRTSQHLYFYANMFVFMLFLIYDGYPAILTKG